MGTNTPVRRIINIPIKQPVEEPVKEPIKVEG